jgi:prepilin-type N-terminal cleavage/methylation domain-containing protein
MKQTLAGAEKGFSAVELLMTIAIAAIFIDAFYTLFNTVTTSNFGAQQQANASGYAYWYLRAYTTSRALYSVPCNSTTDLTLSTAPTATGYSLGVVSGPNASFPLPTPVTLEGKMFWPTGCAAGSSHPLRIQVTVTYGPQNKVVTHATYTQ